MVCKQRTKCNKTETENYLNDNRNIKQNEFVSVNENKTTIFFIFFKP